MDPDTVFERGEIERQDGSLFPGASDEMRLVATDPETGCQGVADFEGAARTAMVFAVRAYIDDGEAEVPYVGTVEGQTLPKNWEGNEPSVVEQFLSLFKLEN
ncbi:MAG: hypothetical protein ABEH64_06865 [Salinirussus sp.]